MTRPDCECRSPGQPQYSVRRIAAGAGPAPPRSRRRRGRAGDRWARPQIRLARTHPALGRLRPLPADRSLAAEPLSPEDGGPLHGPHRRLRVRPLSPGAGAGGASAVSMATRDASRAGNAGADRAQKAGRRPRPRGHEAAGGAGGSGGDRGGARP